MATAEEVIEIQNGLVSIKSIQTTRQMALSDWAGMISTKQPVSFFIGKTQRFIHIDESDDSNYKAFVLTEIQPGRRAISKNLRDGTARRYTLAFPYTYLWFVCNSSNQGSSWDVNDHRILFSKTPFKDNIDHPMIPALLPNVYTDGRICWGSTGTSPRQSLQDRLDILTNEWYVSRFNADLDGQGMIPQGENNYARWVRESAENPRCWEQWPDWTTRERYTVARLLSENGSDPRPAMLTLADSIPPIPVRPTFGAWEQFLMSDEIPPIERARFAIAFDNLRADNPDAFNIAMFETPEPTPTATATTGTIEDGGVVIDFAR